MIIPYKDINRIFIIILYDIITGHLSAKFPRARCNDGYFLFDIYRNEVSRNLSRGRLGSFNESFENPNTFILISEMDY